MSATVVAFGDCSACDPCGSGSGSGRPPVSCAGGGLCGGSDIASRLYARITGCFTAETPLDGVYDGPGGSFGGLWLAEFIACGTLMQLGLLCSGELVLAIYASAGSDPATDLAVCGIQSTGFLPDSCSPFHGTLTATIGLDPPATSCPCCLGQSITIEIQDTPF